MTDAPLRRYDAQIVRDNENLGTALVQATAKIVQLEKALRYCNTLAGTAAATSEGRSEALSEICSVSYGAVEHV